MCHRAIAAILPLFAVTVIRAQDPLDPSEVLMLLRAGVDPGEVEQILARRGGPAAITEIELADAGRLGAGERLLRRLEAALESVKRLDRLARAFEVWRDPGRGVEILVPARWHVAATPADGRLFLTMEPGSAQSDRWFQGPRIFLSLEERTALPSLAEGEIAARIARLVQERVEGLGLLPREVLAGAGPLGGRAAPHHEMSGTEPGVNFPGLIALRTRILPDGSVATLGFTCAREAAAEVRPLFEEIVGAFVAGKDRAISDSE